MNFLELFRVNISYIIFYTIDFFIILFILQKYVFKKINTILEDREKKIKESIENSKIIEAQKAEMERIYREKMIETQKESEKLISEAKKTAELIKKEIIDNANDESKKIVEETKKDIQKIHDQMYLQIKKEITDLLVITISKVLKDTIDEKDHEKIINKSIKMIKNERG